MKVKSAILENQSEVRGHVLVYCMFLLSGYLKTVTMLVIEQKQVQVLNVLLADDRVTFTYLHRKCGIVTKIKTRETLQNKII